MEMVYKRHRGVRLATIYDYLKTQGIPSWSLSEKQLAFNVDGIVFVIEINGRKKTVMAYLESNPDKIFYSRTFKNYSDLCKWITTVVPSQNKHPEHKIFKYANRSNKNYRISFTHLKEQATLILA